MAKISLPKRADYQNDELWIKAITTKLEQELENISETTAFSTGDLKITGASIWDERFWLKADGARYAKDAYPQLARILGRKYTYSNVPATHFNVPDLTQLTDDPDMALVVLIRI